MTVDQGTATASALHGFPKIPVHEIGDAPLGVLADLEPDRLAAILASGRRHLGTLPLRFLDKRSEKWAGRTGNPFLHEVRAVTAGRPQGLWFMNFCYEWGCTTGAATPEGKSAPLLRRTLDWPFDEIGRNLVLVRQAGPKGLNLYPTWPGYLGAISGMAPGRFAIMDHAHLDDPGQIEFLKTWTPGPELVGQRCFFRENEEKRRFAAGDFDPFFRAAAEAGMPVAMLAPDSLEAIDRLAAKYPDLRLTVDHLGGWGGFETRKDHAAMTRMPEVLKLARYPNVTVKATGAPGYSGEDYPYPVMLDYCRMIFESFGPERMFWGTDISKMPVSWTKCIEMFTVHAGWLKGRDLELVMGEALCRFWRWERG